MYCCQYQNGRKVYLRVVGSYSPCHPLSWKVLREEARHGMVLVGLLSRKAAYHTSRHHRIWRLPLFVTSEVKAETSEINQDTCTRVSQCLGLLPLETSRHMCQQPWSAVWYVANSEQILDHRSEKEMLSFTQCFQVRVT